MGILFWIKRLVGVSARPLPVVFLLGLFGLGLLLFTVRPRWRRWGWMLIGGAGLVLFAASFPPLARYGARNFESGQTPLLARDFELYHPKAVVVLGNGVAHPGDIAMPGLTRLNDTARARLVEGVRILAAYPGARLIVTGYGLGLENCADAMADAAVELGVAAERIDRLSQAVNTEHEAGLVAGLVGEGGEGQVILVTTATHMPRALELFAREGLEAVPAPCDFIAPVSDDVLATVNRWRWRPAGKSVSDTEAVWHEYLGRIYYTFFERGVPGEGE